MIREATMLVGGLCFAALSLIPESGVSESPPAESPAPQVAATPESEVEDDEESYGDEEDAWSYEEEDPNFTFGQPMTGEAEEQEREGMQEGSTASSVPGNPNNPAPVARPSQQHSYPAPLV